MGFLHSTVPNTLSAIRVGYTARARYIIIPTSRYSRSILNKLCDCGALVSMERYSRGDPKLCLYKIYLGYCMMRPVVNSIRLLTKPSEKFYITAKMLYSFAMVRSGILILSTSSGIMTNYEAQRAHIGGVVVAWIEM